MPDLIHLPRHDEYLATLVDSFIDISIQREDEDRHPTDRYPSVVSDHLRLALMLANHVSGISGLYEREVRPC